METHSSTKAFSLSTKVVIRDGESRVLILQRSAKSRGNPGKWEFPGGKTDAGESFDAALLREVSEETGLTITLERVVGSGSSELPGRTVAYMFMEGRLAAGVVRLSDEHDAFKWVTLAELAGLVGEVCPQYRAFVEGYCRSLGYGVPPPKAEKPGGVDVVWLDEQVGRYKAVQPLYEELAETLKRILKEAVRDICPLAIVEARAKKMPSFAEKIVRKNKYSDPLVQITDLCGARVVTQTKSEADAVCRFIREHFEIDEKNSLDTLTRLGAGEFGYRSVHYIVRFKPEVFPAASGKLAGLKAEIQVRTLLQHAWSDIGHDRLYKGGFKVPDLWQREAARIAAVLESADDAFSRMVEGIEAYRCNFGAYLKPQEMKREMEIARAVLKHDPMNAALTHRLARLAIASDQWPEAVEVVRAFPAPATPELLCCLGMALCHIHRENPKSVEFQEGRECFRKAIEADPANVEPRVRLAETAQTDKEKLQLFHEAYRINPADPAALGGYIRQRILHDRKADFVPLLRPSIEAAIRRCEDQVAVGVNIPWAIYRIAAFRLLLGADCEWECLDALCRAVQRPQAQSLMDSALASATLLTEVEPARRDARCVTRFLSAARRARFPEKDDGAQVRSLATRGDPPIRGPVVIVAGGCDPSRADEMATYAELLRAAFADFRGTIISGGTREGIAGLVGELGQKSAGRIHTIGYLPSTLPANGTAHRDECYHELRLTDGEREFSAIELVQNWIDLIASGIEPADVRVLGINGGKLAALEYRFAWALGARVAIVRDSGRAADELEQEIKAHEFDGMLVLPSDAATIRAFVRTGVPGAPDISNDQQERLARFVHARFLDENRHKNLDLAMRPWEYLEDSLRQSNRDQIAYMLNILSAAGFAVEPAAHPIPLVQFTGEEVEFMAQMEHGRWNIERLQGGWHYAEKRDPGKKLSPYLVGWEKLDDIDPTVKDWDRDNIRRFPQLLAEIGLRVVRRETK
jgi:ppGpp synthetase/RelA/SpoT-type nucleotidyltranferase/8-oxo-dGTP pyrophosphatase MutT (NUDIX family)